MNLIILRKAGALRNAEGLGEFLPVSSTGHLIIAGDVLDFTSARAKIFETIVQLGAILDVVWASIVGGFIMRTIERLRRRVRVTSMNDTGAADALKIGTAPTFSLFPGVARTAAAIVGRLPTGLQRTTAAEFSFFLATSYCSQRTFTISPSSRGIA